MSGRFFEEIVCAATISVPVGNSSAAIVAISVQTENVWREPPFILSALFHKFVTGAFILE